MQWMICYTFRQILPLVFVGILLVLPTKVSAMNIEKVTSPSGIEAWLVQEDNVPMIALRFAFKGGAVQDARGREGTAYLLSGLLDEGAGELDSRAFQEKVEELTVRLSFDASRDHFSGSFQTLTERKTEAFDLLKLALTKPRFDQDAIDRVRGQILSSLKFDANNPQNVAQLAWFKSAYNGHPYGRPTKGTEQSVQALTREDLIAAHKAVFAREHLKVAVVGDISAEELAPLLDHVFGDLPEKSGIKPVASSEAVFGPELDVVNMIVPQSVVQFGHQGVKRRDDDFIPAYILNYILGGGGFASRLMTEVREKRGLAYSIYSYLYPLEHGALVLGGVATKNASVQEAIELIKKEVTRLGHEGPTEEEFQNAKDYLTGSYALRFDTSSKIAGQLLWIQVEGLGIDYVTSRNEQIKKVTHQRIKEVAKRLLHGNKLRFTVVGQPNGDVFKSK